MQIKGYVITNALKLCTGIIGSDIPKQFDDDGPMDKREINWKLTLHQIGWLTNWFHLYTWGIITF